MSDYPIRGLHGMSYESAEITHPVVAKTPEVLRRLADYLEENGHDHALLTSITTQNHYDNEDEFLTTIVWAY